MASHFVQDNDKFTNKEETLQITATNGMTERASQEVSRHWQTLPALTIQRGKERGGESKRDFFFLFYLQNWARDKSHLSQWETDCRKRKKKREMVS